MTHVSQILVNCAVLNYCFLQILPFSINFDIYNVDVIEEEDRPCDAEECIIDNSNDLMPVWIGCDCGNWFHLYCLELFSPPEQFVCNKCKM
jgi:hypothetical protein